MPYAVAVPVVRAGRRDPDKPRAATELLRAMASWRRTRRRLPRATHGSRVPIEVLTRPSALVLFRRQPNSATATGTSRVWILASPVGARPTDEPTWQLNAWARKASTCQVRCTLVLYPHHSSYRIRMAGWVRTQALLARGYQLPARCPRHGAWRVRVAFCADADDARPACGDSVPARAGHRAATVCGARGWVNE